MRRVDAGRPLEAFGALELKLAAVPLIGITPTADNLARCIWAM